MILGSPRDLLIPIKLGSEEARNTVQPCGECCSGKKKKPAATTLEKTSTLYDPCLPFGISKLLGSSFKQPLEASQRDHWAGWIWAV